MFSHLGKKGERVKFQFKASEGAQFRQAVRCALAAGVAGSVFASGAGAQQPATPPSSAEPTQLDAIEVTGSRLRRVDLETASPIFTIDRQTIERSGVLTVGELIQELPAISGAATNPRVNNGGGTGASVVSLRGLGEDRTLVLLNGRRLVSADEGVDLNQLPLNLIERVDVLKEGASAIYGSDAIGGVVNFITRRDFDGGDLSLATGVSSESDGDERGLNLSWGSGNSKSNILVGIDYHDQEGISAGDRAFAANALYLYSGVVTIAGSSRVPTGRLFLPGSGFETTTAPGFDTPTVRQYDCLSPAREAAIVADGGTVADVEISVTRTGTGTAQGDYRCFSTATDLYNFQPFNLVLTPQERANLFTVANYEITDSIEAYTEIFYNNTRSGFAIAPLPFDTRPDDVVISSQNVFNPFGQGFGGDDAVNPNATFRLEALGNRRSDVESNTGQMNLGLRGNLFQTPWRWNGGISYGRSNQVQNFAGYLFQPGIVAPLGPSFDNADNNPANGVQDPRCGTANTAATGAPPPAPTIISGCTPLNIFNLPLALTDPAQAAQFAAANAGYSTELTRSQKIATVSFDGPVFPLPAGSIQLAVGAERREQRLENTVDFLVTGTAPLFLTCQLAQETCTNETEGRLEVTEFYAEALFPLLADAPAAKALNVILGTRYSDYDRFGSTTNSKIGVEYRPVDELLVRASFAEVFRAPTVTDLFQAITANAPQFNDPCTGLTAADVAANPNLSLACENVATGGAFEPDNGQVTGRIRGNSALEPETGEVFTWGGVYDPNWAPGLSLVADFWNYKLEDTIEFLDVNTTAAICVQAGVTAFCDLINRFPNGQVEFIEQPFSNLGTIETDGVDLGAKYNMAETPFGRFRFGLDTSYTNSFERNQAPGFTPTEEIAGKFSRQDGNFARWRALGNIDWTLLGLNATLVPRYIHGFKLDDPDGAPGVQPPLEVPSTTYFDFSVGYELAGWQSAVRVGVDNLADKQPHLLYNNNVLNANTDVETFDTIGRFFWLKFTQGF